MAAGMSKPDYKAAISHIDDEYKADKTACGSMTENAKDICMEKAKAKEKVAAPNWNTTNLSFELSTRPCRWNAGDWPGRSCLKIWPGGGRRFKTDSACS